MTTIALATSCAHPDLTPDDQALAKCLFKLGLEVRPLVWDDPSQKLDGVSSVVVRSCWDYHYKPREFLKWAQDLESQGIAIHNSPHILRWNHDKNYLRQLESAGVSIPDTSWFEAGSKANLSEVLAERGWSHAVVKPTVSATAWQTFVVGIEDAELSQSPFEGLLAAGGVMVQRFIDEIISTGEWSLVFFDRKFSHGVVKRPKSGDFRVQEQFGGTLEINAIPEREIIAQAESVLDLIEDPLLYARVDGVQVGEHLVLMELELIEPALFLAACRPSAQCFAETIARFASRRMNPDGAFHGSIVKKPSA